MMNIFATYIYISKSLFHRNSAPALIFKLWKPFSCYRTIPFALEEPENGSSTLKMKGVGGVEVGGGSRRGWGQGGKGRGQPPNPSDSNSPSSTPPTPTPLTPTSSNQPPDLNFSDPNPTRPQLFQPRSQTPSPTSTPPTPTP